jgi:DNA-binding NtrC family response regulator
MMDRVTNRVDPLAVSPRCRLRVLHGPDTGLEVEVPPAGLVVGAAAPSDLVLGDPSVSRRHCAIRPEPHGFEVTDLGSSNGTFLDGTALKKATITAGAVLRVGQSLIQLLPQENHVRIPPSAGGRFGEMVGGSLAMRQVYALLERASTSDVPILLMGESGTGKELAARGIHAASPRRDGPLVTFDCGAASESLIESDLFGHMRGAYTGAHTDRAGALELAHGGTLFLDEIGDLPLRVQPKLLRMLEHGEAARLGSTRMQKFDVRFVAATHRDLRDEVSRGTFRGDLYYRLAVVEVQLPPLRRRMEDVRELVGEFLARQGADTKVDRCANLDHLIAYGWPGNVRELRNVVARAVALSLPNTPFEEMPIMIGTGLSETQQAWVVSADRPFHEAKAEMLARFETEYLHDLMRLAGGNVSKAARIAGIERRHLYRLLEKAGMPPRRSADAESDPSDT